MKTKKILCTLMCLAVIFACTPVTPVAGSNMPEAEYVPGEVLVISSNPVADSDRMSSFSLPSREETLISFEDCGIVEIEQLEIGTQTAEEQPAGEESYLYKLEIEGDVLDTCKEIEKSSDVICAEPNYIMHTYDFTLPGELSVANGIYTLNQKWYFDDIMNFPKAWQDFEVCGEDVTVAVIDNGFELAASDFPTNIWTDADGNHGWNTHTDSSDISPITKSDGAAFDNTYHGTNVAGIIGMACNGKNGIGGAYGAQLMLINAAMYINDSRLPSFSVDDVAEAIDYARINGADIINLSLGIYAPSNTVKLAIDRAYSSGIAIIAAAGNGYYNADKGATYPYSTEDGVVSYPAGYSNVIGVMAIDKDDPARLALFSNYDPSGNYYDIAAPGVQIVGCATSDKLSAITGTSQASPLVAASAALYLSKYPNATVDELYNAIKKSPTKTVSANTVAAPTDKHRFKVMDAAELLEYGQIRPVIHTYENAVKNDSSGIIYQLDEGFTDISKYFGVDEGTGTYTFTPTSMGNGTGSLIEVYDNNSQLYRSYRVIIFGDINGDCKIDARDTVLLNCILEGMLTSESWINEAADVDYSYDISSTDAAIIADHAIGTDFVSQFR